MSCETTQNIIATQFKISSCSEFEDIVGKQHLVYLYSFTISYHELTDQILTKRIKEKFKEDIM